MDFIIVHLTDIHTTTNSDLTKKVEPLARAIISEISEDMKVFIVLSGDIANTGIKEEYDKFSKFLSTLKQLLTNEKKYKIDLDFIIVPGNHDCNTLNDNQIRKNITQNINYDTIGNDNSVIEACLVVQKDFWEFYSKWNSLPEDKLYYKLQYRLNNIEIVFHCINTAWVSQRQENVGGLFFPVKKYDVSKVSDSINFGVWHHPYNWFNPNTIENNKLEFEQFTERISSTHFFGHEHEKRLTSTNNHFSESNINLVEGISFNEDKKKDKSGFSILKVNLEKEQNDLIYYDWKGNLYISTTTRQIAFHNEQIRNFELDSSFIKELQELKIPLNIEGRKNTILSDVYVFPDIEKTYTKSDNLEIYKPSSTILQYNEGVIVVDGEGQIGKTSLVNMLFLKSYSYHKYPIKLSGSDIIDVDCKKIIEKAFKKQYKTVEFDEYRLFDNQKKLLFIDDFHECELNSNSINDFLNSCKTVFSTLILVVNSTSNITTTLRFDENETNFYSIKPFGYKKRNEIIEKFHLLKKDPLKVNEQHFLAEVKETFEQVQGILGDKLMPSYPVFLLSILNSLQFKPINPNDTAYGYCYHTLIHYALNKAGLKNDEIDTYINFLSEMAFEFVKKDVDVLTSDEFKSFYAEYANEYFCPAFEVINKNLLKSNLVKCYNAEYTFNYSYILYFLSAKKIADSLNTNFGKNQIVKLFNELEKERNANILIFVAHHSKDISFIEESLTNSVVHLSGFSQSTLSKDDEFASHLKQIVSEVTDVVIDINKNPKEEWNSNLEDNDQRIESIKAEDVDSEIKKIVAPLIKSFRTIEIIGQIVKNRHGSIVKSKLKQLVEEVYGTGFRSITYYGHLLETMKQDMGKTIIEQLDNYITKAEIENRVNSFISFSSFKVCYHILLKLTYCVGSKELRDVYTGIASDINTPAAKLVTFSINSLYGTIAPSEIKKLAEEFKDNPVATLILKARVRHYVYNKDLKYDVKQSLADALKITIRPKLINNNVKK